MTSRFTRARDQSSLSKSELSAKFSKLAGPQQKQIQLNYKSTVRNKTPSIVDLSKHLTGLIMLEEGSELFEKLSKSVWKCLTDVVQLDDATVNK